MYSRRLVLILGVLATGSLGRAQESYVPLTPPGSAAPGGSAYPAYPPPPPPYGAPVGSFSSPAQPPANYGAYGAPPGGTGVSPMPAGAQFQPSTTSPPPASWSTPDCGPGRCVMPAPSACDAASQTNWYSRVDYFHWDERLNGHQLDSEAGALVTAGVEHRSGANRFRVEFFAGNMDYDGYSQDMNSGALTPLSTATRYRGVRGEYELMLEPSWWQEGAFLFGVGSRLWARDIRAATDASGAQVCGYEETWWIVYPFVGVESRHAISSGLEVYSTTRLGTTPMNLELPTEQAEPLYPRCGFLGQVEMGLRGKNLEVAGYFEVETFAQSGTVTDWMQNPPITSFQPASRMYTVGGKVALMF